MEAIDMSILKNYIKMHSTSLFFSHLKKYKNMSLRYVEDVVKRSCISITNVLSVSAYNKITTTPIVKKLYWKNKCHFLPNKNVRLVLSHTLIFVRSDAS